MKDIIENRVRLPVSAKLRLLVLSLKENGLSWTLLMGVYYLSSAIAEKSFNLAAALRRKAGLPGLNSPSMNRVVWESWDWSSRGEEWTQSADWKRSVIDHLLKPHIREGGGVLEIGPGLGRWTETLVARSAKFMGVDISGVCVRECRKRFAHAENATFLLGSGSDLRDVASESIDAIWSFDVFVHINRDQLRSYAREFARVLRPGGVGVIHHGGVGGASGGWRSDVTGDNVRADLEAVGLPVEQQLEGWQDGDMRHRAGLYGDVITIFRKP